ncbi:MAG: hypothetical protein IH961_05110 [Chloroflexi bacterium]|nr:hypothetical protein [Chloroflexota bacterium]
MKTPLTNSVFVKRVGLLTACFSLLVVSALPATEKSSSSEKEISGTETDTVKNTEAAKDKTTAKEKTTKRRRLRGKRPITKPKFDPNAKRVELFDGMKQGQFVVKVIAKNAKQGHVLIENTTDKPLTVQLPKSFVAVHVLKQYGGEGGGGQGGGNN